MTPAEAMDVLTGFLRDVRSEKAYPPDPDGYGFEAPPEDEDAGWTPEASPAARMAREWARELLTAAEADGAGGCRLCKG